MGFIDGNFPPADLTRNSTIPIAVLGKKAPLCGVKIAHDRGATCIGELLMVGFGCAFHSPDEAEVCLAPIDSDYPEAFGGPSGPVVHPDIEIIDSATDLGHFFAVRRVVADEQRHEVIVVLCVVDRRAKGMAIADGPKVTLGCFLTGPTAAVRKCDGLCHLWIGSR